jgi:hypothetical protein
METNGRPRTVSAQLAQTFRYFSEQFRNSGQSKTFRRLKRAEGKQLTRSEEFSSSELNLLFYYGNKQVSNKWRTINRVSSLYDPADKYYHDILRKDNAWEEISAITKCPGKNQIIITMYDELSIVLHRVMKRHWISGTDRFWSSARTFAWSEPGCTVPSRGADSVRVQLKSPVMQCF